MSHALATFLFPIPPARHGGVAKVLHELDWRPRRPHPAGGLHRPAPAAGDAERLEDFVHFMSLLVLPRDPDGDDPRSWLLMEVCADDAESELPVRLAAALPDEWARIAQALDAGPLAGDALAGYLRRHAMPMGTSLLAQPGLRFVGTPGMGLQRIRQEADLAAKVRTILSDDPGPHATSLGKLAHVRSEVFKDAALKQALFSEPVPSQTPHTRWSRAGALVLAALRDYLWALLPLPLLAGLAGYFLDRSLVGAALGPALFVLALELLVLAALVLSRNPPRRPWLLLPLPLLAGLAMACRSLGQVTHAMALFAQVLGAELLLLGLVAGIGYRCLRNQEQADNPLDQEPDTRMMAELMALENFRGVAQNHLSAQSRLKPGWVRWWTLRLALWTIAEITQVRSTPGFLGKIGTIHFARWYLVPGTNRLLFLSNYDGSWQSYLEDFIARLRQGLSSVWSNTRDFPKTDHLVSGGAADGTRFKRWARRQQLPTPAWFTAYPELTASSIRTNAAIRHGLASAFNEAEAVKWLSLLGYAAADTLEAGQVPTLVFGGLAHLGHAHAVVVRLGEKTQAQAWLRLVQPEVSHGPHVDKPRALVLGFTAAGMDKLGLPEAARRGFPTAFLQGMGHSDRARLLGDFEPHDACHDAGPRWGMDGDTVDAICLVYAVDATELDMHLQWLHRGLSDHGHRPVYERTMAALPERNPWTRQRVLREAFGFRDGLSQPILRGTKGWTDPENAQHVVNPGEIVLGYRDNLGKLAPTPCAGGQDYGRNGSFLVVRHLKQDVDAFNGFLAQQAAHVIQHGPLIGRSPKDAEEWVAAKMVGRWRDGASLVRAPDAPAYGSDNSFKYGEEDPVGQRCPFGAHIRRANPRDSLDPHSKVQLAISNRHRILRVGRRLDPTAQEPPGLLFMCLNADIERQFEFLQQTWLLGPNFHGLDNETDPLIGPGEHHAAMTVPGPDGPARLEPLKRFVSTLGGGYFFMPGKDCLERLAGVSKETPGG